MNEILEIPAGSVQFAGYDTDDFGRVFIWNDRVFRGVRKEKEVMAMFACGLLEELQEKNLIPKTWITKIQMEGFNLILEHEKIPVINYPYEWSFNMLKDAALTILKVNKVAEEYGYQTKDAHGHNIIFHFATPKFVDIGSFIPKNPAASKQWIAYEEFVKFFIYTLDIWKSQNSYIAQRILSYPLNKNAHVNYLLYTYPLLRRINKKYLEHLVSSYYKIRLLGGQQYTNPKLSGFKGKLLQQLKKRNLLPFQKVNFDKLIKKINKININTYNTEWDYYHDQFTEKDGKLSSTPRFDYIINILKKMDITDVLELAGNQGVLSRLILERTSINRVTCSDYDEIAVDKLYQHVKFTEVSITPILFDFVYPINFNYFSDTFSRFKSDAVLALAVIHHLVLSQSYPLDFIFNILKGYSKKYVFIEFMPLGLYNPKVPHTPSVPSWYNIEWFRKTFNQHFYLIEETTLEKNRILFIGEIRMNAEV
ncbi:MAG: class I SAM-dependent methyltransferase [Bacteroidia bacterium]